MIKLDKNRNVTQEYLDYVSSLDRIDLETFYIGADLLVDRLNNIINELEKWLGESIEKHTEDYLDWKYDRNVYLAGSKKLQNVLDKLQELKGSEKE